MTQTRLHITQGQFAAGSGHDLVISTLLGSCVSCCLWDPQACVGGMNHILLAQASAGHQARALSGLQAMEVLINDLVKRGAVRERLVAKAFGGARMIRGFSDIGNQNAEFIQSFLAREGIALTTTSFGGTQARNLRFWPGTGRVQQKLTDATVRFVEATPPPTVGHGVELF